MQLFKTTIRTLSRFRLYTVVNILGLALSLSCVILIARYVHQETTVNHFATDLSRTYLMSIEEQSGQIRYGGAENLNNDGNYRDPMNHDGIERFSVFIPYGKDYILSGEHRYNTKLIVTDSNFLKILPYPLLYGDTFSDAPDEIILTRHFAEKLFGNENPVGKTVTFSTGDLLKVAGVIGEPASKSFLDFDLLVNIGLKERWERMTHNLVMLRPDEDISRINNANSDFISLRFWGKPIRYQLVPLKDFYFDRSRNLYQDEDPVFIQGNPDSVKVFSVVALLILFVGLFNFVNIYTVVILKRAREFGVKKIYGAGRRGIAGQILSENFMMVLAALFFAWFFMEVAEVMLAEKLAFTVLRNPTFDIWLSVVTLILLPCIASLYPFLRYTYSAPVTSLRSVNVGGVSVVSRKVFLFLQYVISFGLLIVALFFMKQLNYMLNREPGYKTENVIVCTMMVENHYYYSNHEDWEKRHRKLTENKALIERRMNESPLFTEWLFGSPVYDLKATTLVKRSDKDEYEEVAGEWLQPAYFDMFGFRLTEGRLWDSTDVFTQYKCIINESAKKLFDISDIRSVQLQPERRMWYSTDVDTKENPAYEIVGVIKDFNTGHLSKATVPLMLSFSEGLDMREPLMARFLPGKEKEAAAYLGEIYREINDNAEFIYTLLEDDIARLYEEDKRVSNVYTLFALLAILISCMGLFAISLFDIRQRYREIALRKVNGAKVNDIMRLLLKKYIWLLVAAFAVAVPAAFVVISNYLKDFAHKAPVSWWLFAVSFGVVTGISLLTLVWQVNKAVKANPVESLKSE
jgi:ABC-type antimicrobial peptide transport system, permease component